MAMTERKTAEQLYEALETDKTHPIRFGDKWRARCPVCKGTMLTFKEGEADLECASLDCTHEDIMSKLFSEKEGGRCEATPVEDVVVVGDVEDVGDVSDVGYQPPDVCDVSDVGGVVVSRTIAALNSDEAGDNRSELVEWRLTNEVAWEFVRQLKRQPGFDRPLEKINDQVLPIIGKLYERASAELDEDVFEFVGELEDLIGEVAGLWSRVRVAFSIEEAIAEAQVNPYRPHEYPPQFATLARVCWCLSQGEDGGEFFLAQRDAATALGLVCHKNAGKKLVAMESIYGLIKLVKKGTAGPNGDASTFVWTGPIDSAGPP